MKELFGFDPAKFFEWVSALPPEPLTCIAVLLFGYGLKRADWLPNNRVPLVLMIIGPVFLILARYGLLRFVVEGVIYSGVVWLFHAQIWKRFIAPKLGDNSVEPDTAKPENKTNKPNE